MITILIRNAVNQHLNGWNIPCLQFSSKVDEEMRRVSKSYIKGTLRIRQGWSELELRVGGLGFVNNGSYIITGKTNNNLAFAA